MSSVHEFVDSNVIDDMMQRFETFKILDGHKTAFIDESLQRVQHLSKLLSKERAEFDRERRWLHQQLANSGQTNIDAISSIERDPYVLVLIDGNELLFRNNLLGQGDQGGRLAAQALFQAVNEYAFSTIDALSVQIKVVVRVYVDLEDLCSVGVRTGLVGSGNQIKTFVRGFCQDKALFDLIDVGMQGHAVVFDKMEENLKMYAGDIHCKHIIFGCEDGEIYAPILKQFAETTELKHRITLLSGTQPDRHLAALSLSATQMGDVFRGANSDTHGLAHYVPGLDSLPALINSVTPPLSSPGTSRSNSRTAVGMARANVPGLAHSRGVSISSSINSSEMSAVQSKPKASSWVMAAKKGATLKTVSPAQHTTKEKKQPSDGSIRRNKKGQRIDPPTPEFKKDEVNRLKKLKLCNAHYLREDCPYPDGKCSHDHLYKTTAKELETLKLVARMSACIHGSECPDPKCIYGHRCPFPESKDASMRGKTCINGKNCRFPDAMHNMDMIAVRRLKVT